MHVYNSRAKISWRNNMYKEKAIAKIEGSFESSLLTGCGLCQFNRVTKVYQFYSHCEMICIVELRELLDILFTHKHSILFQNIQSLEKSQVGVY